MWLAKKNNQKNIFNGIFLAIVFLPLYLLRFKIDWLPVNFLEGWVFLLFLFWIALNEPLREFLRAFQKKYFQSLFWPTVFIFIGLTLSSLFSNELLTSAGIWKSWFLFPVFFAFLVFKKTKQKDQLKRILIGLFLSGLVVASISLVYWVFGRLTYDGRLKAFYLSPNFLSMYLMPIWLLSFVLYSYLSRKTTKAFLLLSQLVILLAIYLTYSYGAWLAGGLGLFFLFVFFSRFNFLKIILLSVLLIMLVCFVFGCFSNQKLQDVFESPRSSWQSRLMIWRSAWQIGQDHLILGIGPGLFQQHYLDYQKHYPPYLEWAVPQPHNLYLAWWLQGGLLGLFGFLWLIIVFFRLAYREIKKNQSVLMTGLVAVMIYFLSHGLIDTPYWKNDFAFLFWLVIGLSLVEIKLNQAQVDTRNHFPY